jgi:anthranilate/para-aminobenzoate synthase component I
MPAPQPQARASHGVSEKGFEAFKALAKEHNLVPVYTRMMSDQLTPVVAYQRLVGDDRYAPSFLFESVQNGTDSGRFSFVGAWPDLEILAKANEVTVLDHCQVCKALQADMSVT